MPFLSKKLGIAYFPIPKNGGTSIRHALYRLEHGVDFEPVAQNGRMLELWMLYPAMPFGEVRLDELSGLQRIVVVRDPMERLVSAYRNRVHHYREVERADFPALGIPEALPRLPDFDTFCRHLRDYAKIATIRHHVRPQKAFIGDRLDHFDRVFRLERLDELEDFLSGLAGCPVALRRLRSEGRPRSDIAISAESRALVARAYAADYRLLGGFYGLPGEQAARRLTVP